jgi:hypothetical protein
VAVAVCIQTLVQEIPVLAALVAEEMVEQEVEVMVLLAQLI